VVEIMTMHNRSPGRDWLKFAQTSRAKTKIRHWIKAQERDRSITLGREICEKEFRKSKLSFSKLLKDGNLLEAVAGDGIKSTEDLFAAVGQGRVRVRHIINMFLPEEAKDKKSAEKMTRGPEKKPARRVGGGIKIQGVGDIMVRFGKCCNPIPGDRIMGFITRGRGVTVHTFDCNFLETADPERVLDAQWERSFKHVAVVPIEVICEDKKGLLADVTSSISSTETNIINAKVKTTPDKKAVNVFEIEINGLKQLESVINAVKKVRGVLWAARRRP